MVLTLSLEEEAIDTIIGQCFNTQSTPEGYYRNLTADFEHGLKLVREKTGRTRFFITREALEKSGTLYRRPPQTKRDDRPY